MSRRKNEIEAAKRDSKLWFDMRCVISNYGPSPLEGCHIYPNGSYRHFAAVRWNIVVMMPKFHTMMPDCFDYKEVTDKGKKRRMLRTPDERIEWLQKNCHPSQVDKLNIWLDKLQDYLEEYRSKNGGSLK